MVAYPHGVDGFQPLLVRGSDESLPLQAHQGPSIAGGGPRALREAAQQQESDH